jgi:hypothetical protein
MADKKIIECNYGPRGTSSNDWKHAIDEHGSIRDEPIYIAYYDELWDERVSLGLSFEDLDRLIEARERILEAQRNWKAGS